MEHKQERKWVNAIAETLRAERGVADLSQAQVERITGITRSSYRLYEQGERLPNAIQLVQIAEAFDIPFSKLISEIERRATR